MAVVSRTGFSMLVAAMAGVLVPLCGPAGAQQAGAGPFPGGAVSLNEGHGAWTVSCDALDGRKTCVMAQALGRAGTAERVVSIELVATGAARAEGMLLAPFGLNLSKGAALSIDGTPLGAPLAFFTCIETGCLVPLAFDGAQIALLQQGKQLEIVTTHASKGTPVALALPLRGFTDAFARMRGILGP